MEGCATISDASGQLLFYTDGSFVYNKNHQIMQNGSGLMGHPSSSNSSIIVQQPGSDSLYYIFTTDAAENEFSNGYRYSIVDMSLNSGLGSVIVKNMLLYAKCSEKLTAVKQANGIDAWIVTKDYFGNTYRVFSLTCNGININPVISNVGHSYDNTKRVGSLKASPDGNKIATVLYLQGWEIFDFNKATGLLSNPLFIPYPNAYIFGLEFSPDSKLLYLSTECCNDGGATLQYKIDNYDSALISNSRYVVDSSKFQKGDMQLGPDMKIYIPNEEDSSLNIINNPDQYGIACDYSYKAIALGLGRIAMRCLPAFFKDNITNSTIDFSYSASNDCHLLKFKGSTSLTFPVTWNWDFGDGQTATGQNITHTFNTNGSFKVKLTLSNSNICGANETKTKTLDIYADTPKVSFGYNLTCGSKILQLTDSSVVKSGKIVSWFWDFGDGQTSTLMNPTHTYSSYNNFTIKLKAASLGICYREDSSSKIISINPKSPASLWIGTDTTICKDSSLILNAGIGFKNYYWQDGTIDSIFKVVHSGKYFVTAYDYCGNNYSDTINVTVNEPQKINLGNDTSICMNKPLRLIAGGVFAKYLWNNGSTSQFQSADSPGSYIVTATNTFGCISKDSIKITNAYPAPIISLNKNPVVCLNQDNILNAGSGFSSYIWQDGTTDSIINVEKTGLYKVTVSNIYSCFSSDSVEILTIANPPFNFLNADTSVCPGETIEISAMQIFNKYLWSNGSTNNHITINSPNTVWLKVIDKNNCTGTDTIKIFTKDCSTHFYIPNSFTPNNDGINDAFGPIIIGNLEHYQFTIYNRYGQQIFRSKSSKTSWDGTIKGRYQDSGIFVWTCAYKFKNENLVLQKKGTVLLVR
jgi:gliding motility-associated-like protein